MSDSDPLSYPCYEPKELLTFRQKAIFACWLILIALFCMGLCILVICAPAQAIEINPSVETLPLFCQYSITQPLCDMQKPAAQGPPGPQGPPGIMNQTPNMTLSLPTTYYLHNATLTANGTLYHTMRRYFPTGTEDSNTTTLTDTGTDYLLAQFITEEGDPSLGSLIPGDRKWFTYVSTNNLVGGDTHLQFKLYAYHANGTKNLIYSFQGQNLYDTGITRMVDSYTLDDAYPMNTTDRFIMEYYANTSIAANPTVTMYWDDNVHVSKIESPITLTGIQGPPGPAGTAINESYAYLPGRPGGQSLTCGTNVNDDCTISSTSFTPIGSSSILVLQPTGGKIDAGQSPASQGFDFDFNGSIGLRDSVNLQYRAASQGSTGFFVYKQGNASNILGSLNQDAELGYNSFYGYDSAANARGAYILAKASNPWSPSNHGTNLYYYNTPNASTSNTLRLTLANNGFAGVGTSAPTKAWHVVGDLRVTNCSGTPTFDANGNMFCISDAKYKTNIKEMSKGLSTLKQFPSAKSWNWKEGIGLSTLQTNYGLIAGELKLVYPEAVITRQDMKCEPKLTSEGKTKDDDMYENVCTPTGTTTDSIDQMALIVLLTNSVKELSAQNEAQQAQIDELEARLDKAGIK